MAAKVKNSISVSQAIEAAKRQHPILIPGASGILLEELDLSEDDRYWLVTLSFIDSDESLSAPVLTAAHLSRRYKVFKIDRANGEIRSMKIRELENV